MGLAGAGGRRRRPGSSSARSATPPSRRGSAVVGVVILVVGAARVSQRRCRASAEQASGSEADERQCALGQRGAQVAAAPSSRGRSRPRAIEPVQKRTRVRPAVSCPVHHSTSPRAAPSAEEEVVEALVVGHRPGQLGRRLVGDAETPPDRRPGPADALHPEDVDVQQCGQPDEHARGDPHARSVGPCAVRSRAPNGRIALSIGVEDCSRSGGRPPRCRRSASAVRRSGGQAVMRRVLVRSGRTSTSMRSATRDFSSVRG